MSGAFSTGGPNGQSVGMLGGVSVASSFGVDNTTMGAPGFRGMGWLNSDRRRMLQRRESYFRCTHHDWKMFDFDGRMIPPGPPVSQPLLSSEKFAAYVPLKFRRPQSPYRLARVIVNSFTSLLFGVGRWPTLRVHGDADTEDFVRQLVKEAKLRTLMIRARNIGGSVGTVGLSWRFFEGKPKVRVHNGKHLMVHSWVDREECIPEHVSEIYTYSREEWDPTKRVFVKKWFWWRYDWTPMADVAFLECPFDTQQEPEWVVDEERSVIHNDGKCHFVWIQNLPEDDDDSGPDGQPDYAELYENFEALDTLKSVVVRGATLNLDPTVVLRVDPDIISRTGIRKGSDQSLVVGTNGDARYMELGGQSITAGSELFMKMRSATLEVAQCVVPDPDQVGAGGTSSVALKVIYEPMLAKAEVLREQYGEGIRRLVEQMLEFARKVMVAAPEPETVVDPDTGIETTYEVQAVLALEPRIRMVDAEDPETGQLVEQPVEEPRLPGIGGMVELDWGDYFQPTADDMLKRTQQIQLAVAGKIMSQQTGAEELSMAQNRSVHEEWERLKAEKAEADAMAAGMFPGAGIEEAPGTIGSGPVQPVVTGTPTEAATAEDTGPGAVPPTGG